MEAAGTSPFMTGRPAAVRRASFLFREAAMDWKLFGVTFVSIFLAEFADKTQLATMTFSASSAKPWVVFAAAASALVCVTAVGAFAGAWASRWVPERWLHRAAAALFILVGVLLLVSDLRRA